MKRPITVQPSCGYGLGRYRRLGAVCGGSPDVNTVNKKYFPTPVEDPWLAARVHRPRWLSHIVTHPDHGKTHHSTTEGDIHPATVGTVSHPHHTDKDTGPHPYNFVAHSKTAGGCRGC